GKSPTNRRSLVARPTPMTSSPVAIGSSVPAWPTFIVPRARRTRFTASWEVMPDGLSTNATPLRAGSAMGPEGRGDGSHRLHDPVLRGIARSQPVPSPAEGQGDLPDVRRSSGPQAHLESPVRLLLEQAGH